MVRAVSPVPVVTVGSGALAEPSRNPWRRTLAKFGRARALHNMKLLRPRETAMGGRTTAGVDAEGGAMMGADMVRARAEDVVIAAADEED